jgi:hypothetical protein
MTKQNTKEKALVNLVKQIPNCKCGELGEETHPCPFAKEVHKDWATLCNCCAVCRHNCFREI